MKQVFLSTPSARRATGSWQPFGSFTRFLSTPSARRATTPSKEDLVEAGNFYPRPPRGGRPRCQRIHDRRQCISIHALREEGDLDLVWQLYHRTEISIHALREEGDGNSSKVENLIL